MCQMKTCPVCRAFIRTTVPPVKRSAQLKMDGRREALFMAADLYAHGIGAQHSVDSDGSEYEDDTLSLVKRIG